VFVRVFRNLGKFRGDAPFEHWLARITVSACYDFLRKERRVREQVALDAVEYELHDVGIDAVIAAGRRASCWLLPCGGSRLTNSSSSRFAKSKNARARRGRVDRMEREQRQSPRFSCAAKFKKNPGDQP
jgi:hypothetical protein